MSILSTILANALALFLVSKVVGGFEIGGGFETYLIIGVVLSLLNLVIKPVLKVLTFPILFLSGGLFLIVINAVILFLCQYFIHVIDLTGVTMQVNGSLTYLWAAAILGIANWLISWFLKEE